MLEHLALQNPFWKHAMEEMKDIPDITKVDLTKKCVEYAKSFLTLEATQSSYGFNICSRLSE